jgi:hypothetical protein
MDRTTEIEANGGNAPARLRIFFHFLGNISARWTVFSWGLGSNSTSIVGVQMQDSRRPSDVTFGVVVALLVLGVLFAIAGLMPIVQPSLH